MAIDRRWRLLVVALVVLVGVAFAAPVAATARVTGGLVNPTHNLAPPPLAQSAGTCRSFSGQSGGAGGVDYDCSSPCYPSITVRADGSAVLPLADTPRCTALVMAAINVGQHAEHLRAIVLPTDYFRLSVAEQLFVLTNLERVTRRIPPLVGLVGYLDSVAHRGAVLGTDPAVQGAYYNAALGDFQAGPIVIANHYEGGTSIWAGDNSSPAAAMFGWMYDDGWGGSKETTSNLACTSPAAAGCWGHREIILGAVWGTACRTCIAGSGYAASSAENAWTTSFAMIFLEPANSPRMSFSWNANVLPHLDARYERVRAA